MNGVSMLLREIQGSDRLSVLEGEYQHVVAEQRTVQDTSTPANLPPAPLPAREERENRIDVPTILSNSLPRH